MLAVKINQCFVRNIIYSKMPLVEEKTNIYYTFISINKESLLSSIFVVGHKYCCNELLYSKTCAKTCRLERKAAGDIYFVQQIFWFFTSSYVETV